MAREIRIVVDDETYVELERRAAGDSVGAEQYAAQLVTEDIARARFTEAAQSFAKEHAAGFAQRFGSGRDGRTAA